MGEITTNNNALIDISDTLLGHIQQDPNKTFELLIADEHIGKNRVHLCLVMIEQGWYADNEENFLNLDRTIEQKAHIRKRAMYIRARMNYYYGPEQAKIYMTKLIETILPDHAAIAHLLKNGEED